MSDIAKSPNYVSQLLCGGLAVGGLAGKHGVFVVQNQSAQQASLVAREVRAGMNAAAIIPDHQVARPPAMGINKLFPGLILKQERKHFIAFFFFQTQNVHRHQFTDKQRAATRIGVFAKNRVRVMRMAVEMKCRARA